MLPQKPSTRTDKAFDAGQLLELSKANPAARDALLGLIRNAVERGPVQLRDARLAWKEGRGEDSARILHTMRGTMGTLGATRFANSAMELESAIIDQRVELILGLFETAEQALAETVAAAKALLKQEAKPLDKSGKPSAAPEPGPYLARPVADLEQKIPVWYGYLQSEIKNARDDIKQINEEIENLKNEQFFHLALSTLPSCLVVEDDELITHVLVHLLTREGYRVQTAGDGRVARQIIEKAAEPPGLILLDVMLPYTDGYELIHVIREEKHWTTVPIIMLTAKQQENDIVRALDAGATDYVVKPFQPNELMARLRRILKVKG